MNKWLKRMGLAALGLGIVTGGAALWKREEIARLIAVNGLFAPDRIVANFSHMDRAFLSVPLETGARPWPLPQGPALALPDGFEPWAEDRALTAAVVLDGDRIVHESYRLGTGADDLRISWSVAKSVLSLLTGILVAEGAVALDDPVVRHVPALKGTAYDGVVLEDVLQMESGVLFDEDYLDRNSDINRMGRVLALGGTLDGFTAELSQRRGDPGADMQYVSMDTHVVGMVLRGATGRAVPDLLSEKLFAPMGLEGPARYLTDGAGTAFVLGGLNMKTRDYARIGLLVARDGAGPGGQVVPAAWIEASTRASARTGPGEFGYGYQWWVPEDARPGEVLARGIYGQYVYVDRARAVVVAVNAADRAFREDGRHGENIAMFREIADAVADAR